MCSSLVMKLCSHDFYSLILNSSRLTVGDLNYTVPGFLNGKTSTCFNSVIKLNENKQ